MAATLWLVSLCGCTHFFQPGYTSRAARLLEISSDLEGLGDGPGFGELFPESLADATNGWATPDDPGATQPATQPTTQPATNPAAGTATNPTTQPD